MSLLILGGTGTLGRQIARQALDEGYQVRCLTRNLRRAAFLKEWGAELVYGDLSKPETLPPTLKGIDRIIDASTVRPTDNYNSELIDWKGKIALIEAAKVAEVKKFFFFSMYEAANNSKIPLIDLKLKISKLLEDSGISYTIFQCSGFFQGIINQYAIPVLENQTIWLLGNSTPIAYLDTQDAAKAIISELKNSNKTNKTVPLLGTKFWTSEEVVELCERLSGKTAKVIYIPKFALSILQYFFRVFEFTWNISDRLAFSSLQVTNTKAINSENLDWPMERIKLETYLQEFFGKIMKKLKETNYQQSQQRSDITFL